jgi:hypothetical protein
LYLDLFTLYRLAFQRTVLIPVSEFIYLIVGVFLKVLLPRCVEVGYVYSVSDLL